MNIDKAYIVNVNNMYYVCSKYELSEDGNKLFLYDCLLLMYGMSKRQGVEISISTPLFINNENLDVTLYNIDNVMVYECDNVILEKYKQAIIQIKTDILTISDIPSEFVKQQSKITRFKN